MNCGYKRCLIVGHGGLLASAGTAASTRAKSATASAITRRRDCMLVIVAMCRRLTKNAREKKSDTASPCVPSIPPGMEGIVIMALDGKL